MGSHPAAPTTPRPPHARAAQRVLLALLLLLPLFDVFDGVAAQSLIGRTDCVESALVANGQTIKGSSAAGVWFHYELKLPSASEGRVQLRVELLQPGRRSFGARLNVHVGAVDCSRRSGFHLHGSRPERCKDAACEQIEWVVIPDARGTFHVAVQSIGGDFYLHASTADYALGELSSGETDECNAGDGCLETIGVVAQEGFMSWYRVSNAMSVPDDGLANHEFGIRSSDSGHASHLTVRKVAASDIALPAAVKASGDPDAECFNMAKFGWGLSETFSPESGKTHAAEFILGVQVHASGIDVTARNRFTPCTKSGLQVQSVPACSRDPNESPLGFTVQVRERLATVQTLTAALASEVALGGVENDARVSSWAERGKWLFFRFRASPPQPTGSAWEDGAMSLMRVHLQLRKTGSFEPRALLRANALGGFPLEQLGVGQYQEASCREECVLVVALPPGEEEVAVGIQVDNDDQGRSFDLDAVTMDLTCGWLPTCSDCSAAHDRGLGCMWTPDEFSASGGFCHSSGGRVVEAPQCSSEAGDGATACHVPESLFGDLTQQCIKCPAGCGWCGQPFGGGQHAGACVPEALAEGTRWVGATAPSYADGHQHLMAAGFCSVWETSEVERGLGRCDQLAEAASTGACDIGSGDCSTCGSLSPACVWCADPAAPGEGGQCVPVDVDSTLGTCYVAQYPWLGYGTGGLSCPPEQANTGSREFTDVPTLSTDWTELVLPPALALPEALETQSLGQTHGIASNAVYAATQLTPAEEGVPAVYNLRLRVAANAGSVVKAMGQVAALPVRSSTLAAATHSSWSTDGEVTLPVGVFLGSGLPRQVMFSLEQAVGSSDAVPVRVSVEAEEGVLVATTLGGTVNSATAPIGVERQVCCGGRQVYRLEVDQTELGGSVEVEVAGLAGAAGVQGLTLLASWNKEPTELGSSYRGETNEGGDAIRMGIYLGEAASDRTQRTWYVSINAARADDPDDGASWSATNVAFRVRALRTVPGTVLESTSVNRIAGFQTDLPIWQWVMIAIAIGVVLGLFLAVFCVVNKALYKRYRKRTYEKRQSSLRTEQSSLQTPCDERKPTKMAFDAETPASATSDKQGSQEKQARVGFLARCIGGYGEGGEESGGLLGRRRGNKKKKKRWYDPRTYNWDALDEEDSACHGAKPVPGLEGEPEMEDVEMVGIGALDTGESNTRKAAGGRAGEGANDDVLDSISGTLWRNSVAASTTAEGDSETQTCATPTTTTGSIAAMSVLNERMAVLAQAEELEENRKPRPDSVNPVRSRSQLVIEESGHAGPAGTRGPSSVLDVSHTKFAEPTRTWSLNSQSSFNRANAAGGARLLPSTEAAPERRRIAPPPLSVMLEDGEPEAEEILMLSEEQAKNISAGGEGTKSNPWREERTVAGLLLADEERSKEEATRASMQSSDIMSFSREEASQEGESGEGGAGMVSLRHQYRTSASGSDSRDGAADESQLLI